jgi:16S rRNA (adenine1518-N6/adenine1519-N6)-dimethyltransferase
VVEIGAGLGALTRPLLERAGRVVAIERDRDLVPLLREELAPELARGVLRIEEADAKAADFIELLGDGPRPHVIAGNLPYQITGPLLEKLTALAPRIDRAVVLVQREVAERLTARPGAENWGALSIFVQAQFVPERSFVIRRGAFFPQPGVDSAVVVLEPREAPVAETDRFRELVHAAFAQRRKKLRNAWGKLGSAATLDRAALAAGVDLDARGEVLEVAQFARMAKALEP